MTNRLLSRHAARRSALGALTLLALQAHAVDWQSAPSSLPPRPSGATTAAPGAPQDHRRATALNGVGAAGQILSNVERDLRLDSLRTQAVYDARWAPQSRLGDPLQGSIGAASLQVVRRAAVVGTSPSCIKQRDMTDRITVPLAPNFRIKSVDVVDDMQADPGAATIAGAPASFRVSGPHSFDVRPAAWSGNAECFSRYSIVAIRVVGPQGFDPYTGRATPAGPR
jgi:hypothetical protein